MIVEIGSTWETRHTRNIIADDGIYEVHHVPRQNLDLDVFTDLEQSFVHVTAAGYYYCIVHVNRCRADPKGRHLIAKSPELAKMRGLALVFSNKFGSMMVNFFMRVNRPPVPTQVFADPDQARKYLLDLRRKNGDEPGQSQ